jgi:hypothetical protein
VTTEHDVRMRALQYIDPTKRRPIPLSQAQRSARFYKKHGFRRRWIQATADVDDMLFYLREQWNIPSHSEAIVVAIRYLAAQTKRGLERIDLTSD